MATVEKSVVTFTTIKTMLIVEAQKVGDAVSFYKSAFDAVESGHSLYPKRKLDQELPRLLSSELKLAGSSFVIRDVSTLSGSSSTKSEGSGVFICVETDDVEGAVAKAVDAGAVKVDVTEVETEYGAKGKVTDPFGVTWIFEKKTENVVVAQNDENKEEQEGEASTDFEGEALAGFASSHVAGVEHLQYGWLDEETGSEQEETTETKEYSDHSDDDEIIQLTPEPLCEELVELLREVLERKKRK